MALVITVLYLSLLLFISFYCLSQLFLLKNYLSKNKSLGDCKSINYGYTPKVTIQLPVYNEKYVVKRLLSAVSALDYPKDKLEIQVLDDSTDETTDILKNEIERLTKSGFDIQLIRRPERSGFKAGALAYGLTKAQGEFIAIFDADFVPDKAFLKQTIPCFSADERIGLVQTRWKHLNKNYNILTRLQALGLDFHFTLEQTGRNKGGHFINFNGTAGIWRKACIETSGGWSADTLTEDLDLSYRAQLRGWKFQYLETVGSPAELPVTVPALKNQQFRWSKGAAECARKNLFLVLTDKNLRWSTKIHAVFHLLNSFLFVDILLMTLLSLPLLFVMKNHTEYSTLFYISRFFILNTLLLAGLYAFSVFRLYYKGWKDVLLFVIYFPLFLSFSMGLSLYNGVGVLEGYLGKKSPFIRTPKFNVTAPSDSWKKNSYNTRKISPITWMEGCVLLYVTTGLIVAIQQANMGMIPFMVMLVLGFGFIFISGIKQTFSAA